MDKSTLPEAAFPLIEMGETTHPGMTLRDWFAGMALSNRFVESDYSNKVAEYAYEVADAMLAERKKP